LFSFGGPEGPGAGTGCLQWCQVAAGGRSLRAAVAEGFPAGETTAKTTAAPPKTMVAPTEAMTCLRFHPPACLLMLLALRVSRSARLSVATRKLPPAAIASLSLREGSPIAADVTL
jgi:hypothetical protein